MDGNEIAVTKRDVEVLPDTTQVNEDSDSGNSASDNDDDDDEQQQQRRVTIISQDVDKRSLHAVMKRRAKKKVSEDATGAAGFAAPAEGTRAASTTAMAPLALSGTAASGVPSSIRSSATRGVKRPCRARVETPPTTSGRKITCSPPACAERRASDFAAGPAGRSKSTAISGGTAPHARCASQQAASSHARRQAWPEKPRESGVMEKRR